MRRHLPWLPWLAIGIACGGDDDDRSGPCDYLLAYWMARYRGFVSSMQ